MFGRPAGDRAPDWPEIEAAQILDNGPTDASLIDDELRLARHMNSGNFIANFLNPRRLLFDAINVREGWRAKTFGRAMQGREPCRRRWRRN